MALTCMESNYNQGIWCWDCAPEGSGNYFLWDDQNDMAGATADCNSAASVGGPIGLAPNQMLERVPSRQPSGRPKGRKVMQGTNRSSNFVNFTRGGNQNTIWSGAQTNAGPQDRVYAGNYASGCCNFRGRRRY